MVFVVIEAYFEYMSGTRRPWLTNELYFAWKTPLQFLFFAKHIIINFSLKSYRLSKFITNTIK